MIESLLTLCHCAGQTSAQGTTGPQWPPQERDLGASGPRGATAPLAGCLTGPKKLGGLKTSGTRFIRKELVFSVKNKAVKKIAKLAQTRKQTASSPKTFCSKVP